MDRFKPVGDVQHSGTFNAPLPNILAGRAFCTEISREEFYPELLDKAEHFYRGLDEMIARVGLPVQAPRHGARFGLLMGLEREPVNYNDAVAHRVDLMLAFVRECASGGVYFHDYGGGPCHHGFSMAHTKADLEQVLDAMEGALQSIKEGFGVPAEMA